MSEREDLDRSRRRLLLGFLVGFSLWWGGSIARSLLAGMALPRGVRAALSTLEIAGCFTYLFYGFRVVLWGRRAGADKELAASLNDERVRQARLKAFSAAFFAMNAAQLIPLTTAIPAMIAAQLTLLVGFTTAAAAYLAFERE
jgi:hypothetical protein